jgi:hypothetical protein
MYAQTYTGMDEYGDPIIYGYPVLDSSSIPNEIIIKFREGALNNNLLCYDCWDSFFKARQKGGAVQMRPPTTYDCWSQMMDQRFAVDSGIIVDPALASTMKSFGGKHIRRMTFASPCFDKHSITRLGDTIPMDHYNWMVLILDNDTSMVQCLSTLNLFCRKEIVLAEPNRVMYAARNPNEIEYANGHQNSMRLCGANDAWNLAVGDPEIKIAVVDNGAD